MSRKLHLVMLSVAIISLFILGCSDDEDPVIPPVVQSGSIIVSANPSSLNAPWVIDGPDGYSNGANGDLTMTGLNPGDYSVSWGDVVDWISPENSTQTLEVEGSLTFQGTYLEETEPGTVIVFAISDTLNHAERDTIDAPWSLAGPGNFTTSGVGRDTLYNMFAGVYTITWGEMGELRIPCNWSMSLDSLDTLTIQGMYVDDPGPADGAVLIPPESVSLPTSFTMGGTAKNDETPHEVTLTGRVYMAATEVTNAQYIDALQWAFDQGYCNVQGPTVIDAMDGSTKTLLELTDSSSQISWNGSSFSTSHPNRPVVEVTWFGAAAYCDWLSLREGMCPAYDHSNWSFNSGNPYSAVAYRLPTEAEWELACRAGTETPYNTGECLSSATEANYNGQAPYSDCELGPYPMESTDVSSYPANAWGLFDMHGNVFEWCNDWYGNYEGSVTDPIGAESGPWKVVRGGGWTASGANCRSAHRGDSDPTYTYGIGGFRPVRNAN